MDAGYPSKADASFFEHVARDRRLKLVHSINVSSTSTGAHNKSTQSRLTTIGSNEVPRHAPIDLTPKVIALLR